jgi:hypothetical protein
MTFENFSATDLDALFECRHLPVEELTEMLQNPDGSALKVLGPNALPAAITKLWDLESLDQINEMLEAVANNKPVPNDLNANDLVYLLEQLIKGYGNDAYSLED